MWIKSNICFLISIKACKVRTAALIEIKSKLILNVVRHRDEKSEIVSSDLVNRQKCIQTYTTMAE